MSLADDLAKLDELRRSGAMSETQFEEASAALIAGALGSPMPATPREPAGQSDEAQRQLELARIDREWEQEQRYYLVRAGMGRREIPTTAMAFYLVVVGGGIGVLWIVLTLAILRSLPAAGPLASMRLLFPLLGVIYFVSVIAYGFYCYRRARLYEKADRAYRARRQRAQSDQ